MADTELVYLDGRLSLRSFDFVSVDSVNTDVTGLPGDNGQTWSLKIGVEQQDLACRHCLVVRAQGDMGYAKSVGDNAVVGVAVGGALQNNRHSYGALFAKASIFANLKVSDKTNFRVELENRHHFESVIGEQFVYSFEGRHSLRKNMDVRVMVRSNRAKEYSLSIGYYW
jgi:hypothetical protein